MYYESGVKIGENTYLLYDKANTSILMNGSGSTEEIEEYIKLNNQYDQKLELRNDIQKDLAKVQKLDKLAGKWNILILIYTIIGEIFCVTLGGDIPIFLLMAAITIGLGSWVKSAVCLSKKNRKKIKVEIAEELTEVNQELKEIKTKIDKIKEKNEYREINIQNELEVPITTEENKKSNVKMRVLKLK